MKKIFMMAMAAAAMTFVSCGNKANNAEVAEEPVDSVALLTEEANTAADEVIAQLADATDANALQTALEAVKAKVAEFIAKNPEVAKEYLAKVQGFLAENADKIKAVVGENAAVAGLLNTVTAIPSESVEALVGAGDALKALGIDAASLAGNAVNNAVDAVGDAAENVKDAAANAVENAKDAAAEKANEAVENAKEKAGAAVDKAAGDVKKKLGL